MESHDPPLLPNSSSDCTHNITLSSSHPGRVWLSWIQLKPSMVQMGHALLSQHGAVGFHSLLITAHH